MSATGLTVFDTTVQTTNIWLDEIMEELNWNDRHRAYHALRAVLHTLRDHLAVDEVAQLSAQLPLLVRGAFFEGWRPAHKSIRERTEDQFVSHVSESFALDLSGTHPRQITRAVLAVLERHVSRGESLSLKHVLPAGIRGLLD
ncbi:MAG: DUF2267 domain-containing protein [Planctomycetia bacterium]|nr:DUF2267 domain-containing protein [Planctomycetia bacterium]